MPLRVLERRRHRFLEWTLSEVLEQQGARTDSLGVQGPSSVALPGCSSLAQRTTPPPREVKLQEGRCHEQTYGLRFAVQPKETDSSRSRMAIDLAKSRVSPYSTAAKCVHVRTQWLQLIRRLGIPPHLTSGPLFSQGRSMNALGAGFAGVDFPMRMAILPSSTMTMPPSTLYDTVLDERLEITSAGMPAIPGRAKRERAGR